MNDIYGNIEEYNPNKELKLLMIFDDMTADRLGNKNLNLVATKMFIRRRNLNTSLVFITQYYFAVAKNIRLKFYYKNSK